MSENGFAAAHQKLFESHVQQLERRVDYENKKNIAINNAWQLQMRCFISGNKECVHQYDQLFLEQQHMTRDQITNGRKCVRECEKQGTGYEPGSKVLDNESLNLSRKYYACIRPCIEKTIEDINSEIKVIEKTMTVVKEYLKG